MYILKHVEKYIPKLNNSHHENNGVFLFSAPKEVQADMAIDEYIKLTYGNDFHPNLKNMGAYEDCLNHIDETYKNTSCFCPIECRGDIEHVLNKLISEGIKLKEFVDKVKLMVIINDELSFMNDDLEPDGFVVQFILFNHDLKLYLDNSSSDEEIIIKIKSVLDMNMKEREELNIVANSGRVQFAQLSKELINS